MFKYILTTRPLPDDFWPDLTVQLCYLIKLQEISFLISTHSDVTANY